MKTTKRMTRVLLSGVLMLVVTATAVDHAQGQAPPFSRPIPSIFPSRNLEPCTAGQFESGDTSAWIRAFESGDVSVVVTAVSVNPAAEGGEICPVG